VNRLLPENGAAAALLGKDYRDVVPLDAVSSQFGTSPFCVSVDFNDAFLVRTSTGAVYRAWTAANDGSGVRIQFAFLATIPPRIFFSGFEN
jgi:hypothetical protein